MAVNFPALTRLLRFAALSLGLALLTLGLARSASATIYYVSPTGTGNGSSWATAGPFQPILAAAHAGDQVWALKGGYVGNFTATDGVAVYGGFAGTETSITQRNISRNASLLDANSTGTVYTIPTAATGTNTLDGFTVELGTNRGIYDPSGDKLVISNCTITNNSVTDANGGGIYANGVSVTVTSCSFTTNSANRVNANNITVYGGGLYTGSSTVTTLSTCIFTGNNATTNYGPDPAYGGGIYSFGNATISGCTFSGNGATSYDAGVALNGNASTVTNCTFTGNTNGGLVSYEASTSVSGCTFTNNGGRGMALLGPFSSTVVNCTFTSNNVSDGNGGGLYTANLDTTVDHCTFTGNSANRVNANNVQIYGGGLFSDAGTNTTVTFCTFTGNSATTNYNPDPAFGGGLAAFGTPYIANCTFMENTPEQIQLEKVGSPTSPAYVIDCLIYASGGASSYPDVPDAIGVAQYASSTFAYVTISNNDILNAVNNGGISIGSGAATGGAVSVANNIFYGNGTALYNSSSVTFMSSHNDAFDNPTVYTGATPSPTDLMVDPKFVRNPNFSASPVDYGDLHLQSTSPMINAGDDSYVSPGDTDFDGNPRIVGSHVDIGAYEYQGAPTAIPASLAFSPASLLGGTQTTGTITLSEPAPAGGAVVMLTSSNTTAAPVPASVTVAAGATSATFKITTGSVTASTNVTVTATLNSKSVTGTLTIAPQSIASLTLSGYTVTGGNALLGTVTLTYPAATATTVTLTPTGSCSVSASVTIPAGSKTATFNITTSVVPAKIGAAVTATLNGKATKIGFTLLPPQVSTLTLAPNNVIGGTPTVAIVVLTVPAPAGGIVVNLTSSNPNAASVPATVTVPAGAYTATFMVTTTAVTGVTKVTIDSETTNLIGAAALTLLP